MQILIKQPTRLRAQPLSEALVVALRAHFTDSSLAKRQCPEVGQPTSCFLNEGLAWPGSQGQGDPTGARVEILVHPPPTYSFCAGCSSGGTPGTPARCTECRSSGEGNRAASDQVRPPDTYCPLGPSLTLITASAPSFPRQVSSPASQGSRTGAGASWSR